MPAAVAKVRSSRPERRTTVPTATLLTTLVLAVAQVEAMREAIQCTVMKLHETSEALNELRERDGEREDVLRLPHARRAAHDERLAELTRTQRLLTTELTSNKAKFRQRLDDLLERSTTELTRLVDSVDKTYTDVLASTEEVGALERLTAMCAPFSLAALAERDEPRPTQPVDLGPPHLVRTLLRLAEHAGVSSPRLSFPRASPNRP